MVLSAPWYLKISSGPDRVHVESSGRVSKLALSNGDTAWLAGDVEAVRARSGEWLTSVALGTVLDPSDLPGSVTRLEGRFVLVVEQAAGVWVGTDPQGRADVFVDRERGILTTDLSGLSAPARGGFDQAAWAHALVAYGYRAPKRHTPYTHIHRLGIGESARLAAGSQLALHQTPFVPAVTRPLTTRSLDDYADRLLEAVRVRGSRHGNVVYLSSGWDSTAILACLVHLFGPRKVRAVIGRMQYAERSGVINQFEIDRARAVADYYGVRLDVAEFDYRTDAPAILEQVQPIFRNLHLASVTGINHYVLARHVAATTTGDESVFAGEISDGAHNLGFSQFTSIFHPTQAFREYSDKMAGYLFGPTFLQQLHAGTADQDAVHQIMRARLGNATFDPLASLPQARTRQLLSSLFLRGTRFPLMSLANVPMLTPAGAAMYASSMEDSYLSEAGDQATADTLYAWYLHLYQSFHWQGATVATLAVTGEALGLRMALPFWDSRLQESLAAMPEDAGRGLDLHPTKYPLKWTLRHRLDYPFHLQVGPHSYLYDVDPSFSHSAELAFGSSFRKTFVSALQRRPHREVLDGSYFDLGYLDGLVDRYVAGQEVRGQELNDVLSLALLSSVGWYSS